ncbi:MAG: hypothetical protein HRU31_05305 [Rhodobacteraceae bacterium]|nr:hypothetical protein [Paracoccaceae bacterium]
MALADVIDHGYAPGSNVLTGQTSCDGLIALWSYLASHTPSASGAESDLSKVIHALSTLPAPLRAHVGPMLVERLIQADQADYADQVLRIMTGSPSDRKDPAQVATAMVAAGQGDPDHARRTAEQVIEDQAPEAASAFPVLVQAAFDQRSPLQEAQIDLLRSYVVEHRGTQLGEKLEKALILALGLQRQFGDAVQGLLALDPLPAELASQLAQVLTEAGTDIDFLRYALATDNPWQGLPGNPALLAMSERLIDLGFPSEARNLAIASQDGRVERDRRLMRARAALDMRNPAWALRDLKGLTGPDADPLRAEAYEQSDSLDDASLLYARLGDTENVDRLAWQRHSDDGWRTASPDVADSPDKEEGLRPADQESATLTATAPPQDGVGRADTPPAEIPPIDAPRDPLSDSGADPSLETRYGALIDAARNLSQAVPAAESLDISASLARDLKTNSAQTRALVEQLLSRATAADVLE